MDYRYFVYDIEWEGALATLPEETTITLPADFVEDAEIEEHVWHDAVVDALQRQFGHRARDFRMDDEPGNPAAGSG